MEGGINEKKQKKHSTFPKNIYKKLNLIKAERKRKRRERSQKMYKRLEKRMKDADYESDMLDVLETLNDNREKYLQSQGLIDLPTDPS